MRLWRGVLTTWPSSSLKTSALLSQHNVPRIHHARVAFKSRQWSFRTWWLSENDFPFDAELLFDFEQNGVNHKKGNMSSWIKSRVVDNVPEVDAQPDMAHLGCQCVSTSICCWEELCRKMLWQRSIDVDGVVEDGIRYHAGRSRMLKLCPLELLHNPRNLNLVFNGFIVAVYPESLRTLVNDSLHTWVGMCYYLYTPARWWLWTPLVM